MDEGEIPAIANSSEELFLEGFACSQSLLLSFAGDFGLSQELAKGIASGFGGGMGRLRRTCGALTGAYMVLGLKYGNREPQEMDRKLDTYALVRELTRRFEERFGTSDCGELIRRHCTPSGIEERKHHRLICQQVVRSVHELLLNIMTERE